MLPIYDMYLKEKFDLLDQLSFIVYCLLDELSVLREVGGISFLRKLANC